MRVAIGLGCSLGDRRASLELALRQLASCPGLQLLRASRWHRTPPMRGSVARGWFLNGVALFESDLGLEELLARCKRLERDRGRRRVHWGDRPLDLDLLVAEDTIVDSPLLTLPHRAVGDRSFVLYPLLEVWPDAADARTGRSYAELPPPPGPRPSPIGQPRRPRSLHPVRAGEP